jgi:L-ascorbate metabolism protein UlaG (beta-lactamase superfamily)
MAGKFQPSGVQEQRCEDDGVACRHGRFSPLSWNAIAKGDTGMRTIFILMVVALSMVGAVAAQTSFEQDVMKTSAGDVSITFIGHGTLIFDFDGKIIHVDPFGGLADYDTLPDANIVFITHQHGDHFDANALDKIRTDKTVVVLTAACADKVAGGMVVKNGDVEMVEGIKVEVVPAYNLVNKRDNGQPYHPKGEGNGYVLTFGDTRVYIAGDTENTPEMKALENIDYAFLPMNLPYTMTPEMVADAAAAFKPGVLYPYHYGDTDVSRIVELLESEKNIEVRIRKMK